MAAIPAVRTSTTVLNPGLRVAARPRARSRISVMPAALAFAGLTYGFFSAASLAGSVLGEQARRDGLDALARAKAAKAEVAVLEKHVNGLRSLASIDRWAAQQGFVAPESALVASLRKASD